MDRIAAGSLCCLILYFAYHAFAGEAGLGAYADKQTILAEREAELAALEAEIERLEADILRVSPETIDPDYVEALARERLAYVFPNEYVIVD